MKLSSLLHKVRRSVYNVFKFGKREGAVIVQIRLFQYILHQIFHLLLGQMIIFADQSFNDLFQIRNSQHIVPIKICNNTIITV
jgi:hypothetical protein